MILGARPARREVVEAAGEDRRAEIEIARGDAEDEQLCAVNGTSSTSRPSARRNGRLVSAMDTGDVPTTKTPNFYISAARAARWTSSASAASTAGTRCEKRIVSFPLWRRWIRVTCSGSVPNSICRVARQATFRSSAALVETSRAAAEAPAGTAPSMARNPASESIGLLMRIALFGAASRLQGAARQARRAVERLVLPACAVGDRRDRSASSLSASASCSPAYGERAPDHAPRRLVTIARGDGTAGGSSSSLAPKAAG